MADYYPLLSRALDALPDRTPALRKAVYDRARSALLGQLRSLDPPVSESDIDLERQALDAAIERLESGYDDPIRPAGAAAPAPKPASTPVVKAEPAPKPVQKPEAASTLAPRQLEIPVEKPPAQPPHASGRPEPVPLATPELPPEAAPLPSAQPLDLSQPSRPAEPVPGPAPEFVPFVPPPRKPRGEPKVEPPPEAVAEAPTPTEPDSAEAGTAPPLELTGARRPRIDVVAPRANRSRLLRNVFVGSVLAVVIGLIAVAAFLLRDQPQDLQQSAGEGDAPTEQSEQKFGDRVGGETAQPEQRAPTVAPAQPDVTVAQRAILYEENTADPRSQPKATNGRAIWRLDTVNGEQGQRLQNVVRAKVEFAENGVTLNMTIRKNLDASLSVSHWIELSFVLTGPSQDRSVQEVGLIQLKDDQNGRGSPVSGLPNRVQDNLFLIGLSSLSSDVDRNTELLTHRSWLDLALKFKSGQRAVIIFDKGGPGTQVMQTAFDQWKQ